MRESIWNTLIKISHPEILLSLNTIGNTFLQYKVDQKVSEYNAKLAKENGMTFVTDAMGENSPFNYTMTKAPEFRSSDKIIELHMDGRFVNPETNQTDVAENTVWTERQVKAVQKEQVYIHESTLTSLLFDLSGHYDFVLNGTELSESLLETFPELKTKFGSEAVCEVGFELAEHHSEQAVLLDTARGVVYGDNSVKDAQRTIMTVLCASDSESPKTTAVVLESNLMVVLDARFDNFVIYHQITSAETSATKVISNNVSMLSHEWDLELEPLIAKGIVDYNAKNIAGDNLAKKWPTVKFVAGML